MYNIKYILLLLLYFVSSSCSSYSEQFINRIVGVYSLEDQPYNILTIYNNGDMLTNNNNIVYIFQKAVNSQQAIYQDTITQNYYPFCLSADNNYLYRGNRYFSIAFVKFIDMTPYALKQ